MEPAFRSRCARGADPRRDLQAAWNAHGGAGFAFEPLETLEDESLDFALQSALDERTAFWRAETGRRGDLVIC